MKSMKILVTPEQPIEEIVIELERLGFINFYNLSSKGAVEVESFNDGTFDINTYNIDSLASLTSLAELKAM